MTMRCIRCGGNTARVLDSRPQEDGTVKRRRVCASCGARFTTTEKPLETEEAS